MRVHATEGNLNNDIGLPMTVLSAPDDTEAIVTELGMNHRGEISTLSRIISPTAAIITNIGTAHVGNLGSREEIAAAKREITDGMTGGRIYVGAGEPLLDGLRGRRTVSTTDKSADIYAEVRNTERGYAFDLWHDGERLSGFSLNTKGRHILTDLLFALGVALDLGLSPRTLAERCSRLPPSLLRHTVIELGDFTVVDDSYNSSPEALQADYTLLRELGDRPMGAALGDILELGDMSEGIHRQVGEMTAKSGISRLYLVGKFADSIADGARLAGMSPADIFIADSVQGLARCVLENHRKGEIILFKASHAVGLAHAVKLLKE